MIKYIKTTIRRWKNDMKEKRLHKQIKADWDAIIALTEEVAYAEKEITEINHMLDNWKKEAEFKLCESKERKAKAENKLNELRSKFEYYKYFNNTVSNTENRVVNDFQDLKVR